jgi:hypothetical protein
LQAGSLRTSENRLLKLRKLGQVDGAVSGVVIS